MTDKPKTTWQPIDTAPKDGTQILGVYKTGIMSVVEWYAGEWEENDSVVSEPMFWMPLPDAPKEALS